ncbi:MAG TPA: hypothetical protein VK638_39890 [Edaphobacter sp.]|nr:hypothetical protein [Edaphobacter sp.]
MQPQFHVHGTDILQIHRSPFRNDVVRKIERVGLDGGIGFFLFGQLVFAVVGNEFRDGFRHCELGVDCVAKRIGCFLRIPEMRIASYSSEGSFPIGASPVGLFIPAEHPHIGTGFALQSQEASLL